MGGMTSFQVLCNYGFRREDLHLTLAPRMFTCLDSCAKWNTDPFA